MTTKSGTPPELIEALQSFLESFTQDLTEQQFIPAFREELGRLVQTLDNLQQSEETLQQIAGGVERLRDLFAPAGKQMLDGVRNLEELMKENADHIRQGAEDVLKELTKTHGDLETSLRSEAKLMQEHSTAGREALARTTAEVEERLQTLTGQIQSLCEKAEQEVGKLEGRIAEVSVPAATPQAAAEAYPEPKTPVTVDISEDLQNLVSRTESTLREELSRHQQEISKTLEEKVVDDRHRQAHLESLQKTIQEALASVAPTVQDELEGALTRLRDQFETLLTAEAEARAVKDSAEASGKQQGQTAAVKTAVSASESRLMRELSDLRKDIRKTVKQDRSAAEKALSELLEGLQSAVTAQYSKLTAESASFKESLTKLEWYSGELTASLKETQQQLAENRQSIAELKSAHQQSGKGAAEEIKRTAAALTEQNKALEKKLDAEHKALELISSGLSRMEKAATAAAELAMADSRQLREKTEAALTDLRGRIENSLGASAAENKKLLQQLGESWLSSLESMREHLETAFTERSAAVAEWLESVDGKITSASGERRKLYREIQDELKRTSTHLEDRFQTVQTDTDKFLTDLEHHVKAVSGEVGGLQAGQEKSLEILKEAIRANYDDNAERLKEVINGAYNSFLTQIKSVPQSLDRYSKLMESLHQGDQLALEGVAKDTKNLISLATEKFEDLLSDSGSLKKLFPLMDKKLEKHAAEMSAMRKAQIKQDRDLNDLKTDLAAVRDTNSEQTTSLKEEISQTRSQAAEQFAEAREAAAALSTELKSLKTDELTAFKREITNLMTSRFEFIESSQKSDQESLKSDLFKTLRKSQSFNKKLFFVLTLLALASLALQLLPLITNTPPVIGP